MAESALTQLLALPAAAVATARRGPLNAARTAA
jgi:hypothetical protein